MNDSTRDALRELLGSSVLEVHDLRPEAEVRHVWRVRTAGHRESVIVKAVDGGPDGDRAWADVRRDHDALVASRASGVVPEVVAVDDDRRVLVIEDLGDRRSLADVLLGDDRAAATAGVVAYATALGRLHRATSGCPLDAPSLLRGRFVPAVDEVAAALHSSGVVPSDAAMEDVAAVQRVLEDPGPWRALVHGDPCPDNNALLDDGTAALFDFEYAGGGHALVDAAYLHLPFPTCWCANALPADVVDAAEAAYEEANPVDGSLGDLAAAAVAWCVVAIAWDVPRFGGEDRRWGIALSRPRYFTRLRSARILCERAGRYPDVARFLSSVERELGSRWPDAAGGLPLYPAFR